jgi:hypothetical protein
MTIFKSSYNHEMLLGEYQGLQSTKIWLLYISNLIGCSEYTLGIAILKALFESAMILRWPTLEKWACQT